MDDSTDRYYTKDKITRQIVRAMIYAARRDGIRNDLRQFILIHSARLTKDESMKLHTDFPDETDEWLAETANKILERLAQDDQEHPDSGKA